MKKESYAGTPRHGGEYDSEVVQREGERIKSIFAQFVTTAQFNSGEKKSIAKKDKASFWKTFWNLLGR